MIYYYTIGIIPLLLSALYFNKKGKFSGFTIPLAFVLIPISNMGNLWLARSSTLSEALICNHLVYLGVCVLNPLMMLTNLELCKIKYKKWMPASFFILNFFILGSEVTNEHHHQFYKSILLEKSGDISYFVKDYGPIHTLFYISFLIYIIIDAIIIVYGIRHKKEASIKSMIILGIMVFIGVVVFFIGRLVTAEYEITPVSYICFQLALLLIEERGMLYNFDETISDSMIQKSGIGYMAVDRKERYLGSNDIAKSWFPSISNLKLDQNISINDEWLDSIRAMISEIRKDNTEKEVITKIDEKTSIKIKVDNFNYNSKNIGFIIWLEDVTLEQTYLMKVLYEKEHDLMTGLYNRGKFLEMSEEYYRTLDSIAIIYMDINYLKKANDTYGHELGDKLIINTARTLVAVLKDNIKGYRIGGDEFVLIGENLSPEETDTLIKYWKMALSEIQAFNKELNLSVSYGFMYGEKGYDLDELMNEADKKMYENKKFIKSNEKNRMS